MALRDRAVSVAFAVVTAAVLTAPALAVQPDEILADSVMEQRARGISAGLRCLVCQNQSIDDSDAPLARDLRLLVRERLTAGDSDGDAISFVVARYGDFVLLKPPFNVSTLMLWISPLLLLLGGAWMALRAGQAAPRAGAWRDRLSADEQARLETVLKREDGDT